MTRDLSHILLKNKRANETEFFINFFEYCNMSCSFCWQDHDDWTGEDSIVQKADDVIAVLRQSVNSVATINLMGGELFADAVSDQSFVHYHMFLLKVKEYCERNGIHARFNFVTNLVFTKTGRVLEFMERMKSVHERTSITTSYDEVGRFNQEDLNQFSRNIEIFKPYIGIISIVLTRQNIEKFLSGRYRGFFDYLYATFEIYFDTYSPAHRAESHAPSDQKMLDMYLFLIDHYPKVHPIKSWIEGREATLNCRGANVIGPEGPQGKCSALVPKKLEQDFPVELRLKDITNLEDNFLETQDCLSCEYFHKCDLGCFLLHSFKGRQSLDECIYKLARDHIKKVRKDGRV